ncbi:hypothetical protein G5S52_05745 [Grimontia sp. S25]|uniref:Uncharacterized protein n=1 Tax=Grimontia sedimenti TaxID=2711294 RepID=A0A6M1RAN0_9GAMM|nr:hypothetical protein [Grimontia sedimenti]NGN97176.1 hypothetical protein [Grimontia sedimenti]
MNKLNGLTVDKMVVITSCAVLLLTVFLLGSPSSDHLKAAQSGSPKTEAWGVELLDVKTTPVESQLDSTPAIKASNNVHQQFVFELEKTMVNSSDRETQLTMAHK